MRFFKVSLDEMRDGRRSVWSVAACAAHLPRGGAVGEWYGGDLAVTSETAALWELTHVLAQVNSQKKIKPRPMPDGVRDIEAKARRTRERLARVRAYKER